MLKHLIGIAGFRRSGKDTLAHAISELAQARGFAVATIAFADPLRKAASAAYGVDVAEFTDDKLKDAVVEAWGLTRRQMLINMGEGMRSFDPDHWVKAWRRAVEALPTEHHVANALLILTPDLRRVNEAQTIHNAQGVNVLLRRSGVTWDGHINEALAEVAQHRNEALAAKLQCEYAASNPMSISTDGHRLFDCVVDNPVSAGCAATPEQRQQLYQIAAQVLDRVLIRPSLSIAKQLSLIAGNSDSANDRQGHTGSVHSVLLGRESEGYAGSRRDRRTIPTHNPSFDAPLK